MCVKSGHGASTLCCDHEGFAGHRGALQAFESVCPHAKWCSERPVDEQHRSVTRVDGGPSRNAHMCAQGGLRVYAMMFVFRWRRDIPQRGETRATHHFRGMAITRLESTSCGVFYGIVCGVMVVPACGHVFFSMRHLFVVHALLFFGTVASSGWLGQAWFSVVNSDEIGTHACEKLWIINLNVARGEAGTYGALIGHRQQAELGHAHVESSLSRLSCRVGHRCRVCAHRGRASIAHDH